MFNDRKQKVIVFPDVSAQDTVVFTISRTQRPPFAGQFFGGDVFRRSLAYEEARESITLPKTMAAHVEVEGVEHQVEEKGDAVTHKFLYLNPRPGSAGPTALSPWDTDPHYIISTFADYATVGAAYRALAAQNGVLLITSDLRSD